MRSRVGYLAGSGHSGSTLLALLMDCHPEIVSVGETSFKPRHRHAGRFDQRCSCGRTYGECEFWGRVFAAIDRRGFEAGPKAWPNDYRYADPRLHRMLTRYSSVRAIRQAQYLAEEWLPFHRSWLRRADRANVAFIEALLEASGAQVFFDTSKRAQRLRHLLRVPELDVKIVLLVRDVRGYVASAKRRGLPVQDEARAWLSHRLVLDEIAAAVPADRRRVVRYEDLCGNPREVVPDLHVFLGVPPLEPPPVIVPREHHVLGNRLRHQDEIRLRLNDSWRTMLTADEVADALRIAGAQNRALGYAN